LDINYRGGGAVLDERFRKQMRILDEGETPEYKVPRRGLPIRYNESQLMHIEDYLI
jgi:hypothetical protein